MIHKQQTREAERAKAEAAKLAQKQAREAQANGSHDAEASRQNQLP